MTEFILIIIAVIMVYNVMKERMDTAKRFEIELTAASNKKPPELSFDDCKAIINQIINFICINDDVVHGYFKKTQEAFSLEIEKIIVDIALRTRMSISPELIKQLSKFVITEGDDNFLDTYILNSTRIILLDELSYRRKSLSELEPIVSRRREPMNHTITTERKK